ncbi:MAG: DinB family protein [Candidatus Eisenbacteria bacterium]
MERTSDLRGSREIDILADEIHRAHAGQPWHGPSVSKVLEGVTGAEAATRALVGAHTIWELALHIAAWRGEVARRLETGKYGEPLEGDWPEAPAPAGVAENEAAWAATKELLASAEAALQKSLASFPPERLGETFGGEVNPPLGTGTTFTVMLHGVAQHDAYHAGQVMMLKKALVAASPPEGSA